MLEQWKNSVEKLPYDKKGGSDLLGKGKCCQTGKCLSESTPTTFKQFKSSESECKARCVSDPACVWVSLADDPIECIDGNLTWKCPMCFGFPKEAECQKTVPNDAPLSN